MATVKKALKKAAKKKEKKPATEQAKGKKRSKKATGEESALTRKSPALMVNDIDDEGDDLPPEDEVEEAEALDTESRGRIGRCKRCGSGPSVDGVDVDSA